MINTATTLARCLIGMSLIIVLNACTNIPAYKTSPAPAPEPASIVVHEPPPVLETQPIAPVIAVEPSIPLPAAATQNFTLSAATRSLVNQATSQRQNKNFVQAAATLERALRIEPKNPLLWLEYGALRMDERNFAQAESMGRKALASATGDVRTQASAWRLIADSYKARNQNSEAQQAYARASTLSTR